MILRGATPYGLLIAQIFQDIEKQQKRTSAYAAMQYGIVLNNNKKESSFRQNDHHHKKVACRIASHEVCHG